jgi:ADP-ribose pyrophosphatase YjhB (NUDIX family)
LDLIGWELPGGNMRAVEACEEAVRREVREETGLEVAIERHVGDYIRTGFRPHTAHVFRCHVTGGQRQPSAETPAVRWFPLAALPDTLFPWYREPIADALTETDRSVERRERQGMRAIWEGMKIDVRMRLHDGDDGGGDP